MQNGMAPKPRRAARRAASSDAGMSMRIEMPVVESYPVIETLSLILIGTPCRGPFLGALSISLAHSCKTIDC
jgi:hypothetical protein